MFNKKMLLVLGGYIAWSIVNSLYNDTKWKELKKEIKQAKKDWYDSKRLIMDNFIETHSNLLRSLKKDVLTDENIAYFNEKKEDAKKIIHEYKIKWEEVFSDLKGKGTDFVESKREDISELYDEGKKTFEKAKIKTPKELKKIKDKIIAKAEGK